MIHALSIFYAYMSATHVKHCVVLTTLVGSEKIPFHLQQRVKFSWQSVNLVARMSQIESCTSQNFFRSFQCILISQLSVCYFTIVPLSLVCLLNLRCIVLWYDFKNSTHKQRCNTESAYILGLIPPETFAITLPGLFWLVEFYIVTNHQLAADILINFNYLTRYICVVKRMNKSNNKIQILTV